MKRSRKIVVGVVASLGIGLAAAASGQPFAMGPGMMHGMGPGTGAGFRGPMGAPMAGGGQHDDAFAADMQLVRDLIHSHDKIKRTVTNLPDGIRTVTESDDPQVAQTIKAHVASMDQRLKDGRVFNLFSHTLPTLFEKKDKIQTRVETTAKGSVLTQTSTDSAVVAALQAHAVEVSDLAHEGQVAMMRGMQAAMARAPGGRPGFGPNFMPPFAAPVR